MKRLLVYALVAFTTTSAFAQNLRKEPTQAEIDYFLQHPEEFKDGTANKTTGISEMPADARFPGEYEEVQATAIGWPYSGSTLDTTSNSARLWAKLAAAIHQECPVWIRLKSVSDTNKLKAYMINRGTPLVNYRFFFYPSNAYWMRDFGPLGFYYSNQDSVGFLDLHYYNARPQDDQFPAQVAAELGYKNVVTQIYAEGGNYMTDGWRNSFHSSKIIGSANTGATHSPPWSSQQAADSVKYYWASDSVTVTQGLSCDGGTQHIDMYLKLVDEQTFAIMEYPAIVTASDKAVIDSVISMVSKRNSTYGKPYRIFKMPMPTRNDGTYSTTCSSIDGDARTFVNGLMVNKTYIMPSFSSATSGNKAGDSVAVELFKKILPGYNIVPIDARLLTLGGGAIHCVTMQIPAENPLRIWHPALVDEQPLASSFHLIARITNKSGISSAACKWRKKGTATWNTVALADSSAATYKLANISGSFVSSDTIEYYITASSVNGKTVVKPLTAPTGFYTFYFDNSMPVTGLDNSRNFILNAVPNPSTGEFYIPVSLENSMALTAIVTDITGRIVKRQDFGKRQSGMSKLEFNLNDAPKGVYFIQINADGQTLETKKIIIQ